ncbi:MAG TPA: anhydro-N-acetylmuramic acid kinase [Longimicrobiales bacterium]|nr:anhydro-N-acetylmuramic acid kinase [Longimicrobiales bacterium]
MPPPDAPQSGSDALERGGETRIIGLMSGTSLDGIDAALVRFGGGGSGAPDWSIEAFRFSPYTDERRERIRAAIASGGAAALATLHADLGEWLADAALELCEAAGVAPEAIAAIGSHGQTIWHAPPAERRGATLQLGCAATIAERTGCDVISDFRSRDVAAGGHGAPLVAWVDRLLFAHPDHGRVLANLGGIANVSHVPAGGVGEVVAFDTGPANVLIDAAVELATEGAERFDRDGERARRGRVMDDLLALLRDDPYFDARPPKTTGRERYGPAALETLLERVSPMRPEEWDDVVATLTELTASTVADAVRRWLLPRGAGEVVVAGGGARNPYLLERLQTRLPEAAVTTAESIGLDPDAKEALAFAALAWAHLMGLPANEPAATGAKGPRVLGARHPGRNGSGNRGGRSGT